MQKKFLISVSLIIAVLAFSFSYSFATNNPVNTVEDAAKGITSTAGNVIERGVDATKNVVGGAVNGTENVVNGVAGTTHNKTNTTIMGGANNNYSATRTSADTATFAGMTATGWTWFIVGILGVAIVALVWFYGRQYSTNTSSDHTKE